MADPHTLYQELILDHNRHPRNFRAIDGPTVRAEAHNPLCGDQFEVYLTVADDRLVDVAFTGTGCAIAKASASMMTTALKNKTREEAEVLFARFQAMLETPPDADPPTGTDVGDLVAFDGVRKYPVRIKCATLAWQAVLGALANGEPSTVTR